MKFVCDRCQTRYSIADEKVRQKILRIRCKTCGNVIVVQDEHLRNAPADEPGNPGASSSALSPPSSGPKSVPSSGPKRAPSSGPKAPPPPPRSGRGEDRLGGHVEWYMAIDGEQSGPFSRAELAKRVHAVAPNKSVHVWKDGMAAWKRAKEVSVLVHELSLLRAPPPLPPAARQSPPPPTAKVGRTPAPVSVTPAPAVASARDLGGIGEITAKEPKPLHDVGGAPVDEFREATTKKTKELRELVAGGADGAYTEATTKKGKNLRELEAVSSHSLDAAAGDRTPPPVQPLPPVGLKPTSPPPPPFRPAPAPLHAPVVSFDAPSVPAPRPSQSMPAMGPSATPFASPAPTPAPIVVPPGAAFPLSVSPAVPVLAPGELPTPRPLNVIPLDAGLPLPGATEPAKGLAALFQRQPGLKYVAAVLAVIVLIILLVLVVLRGKREPSVDATVPAAAEPRKAAEPVLAAAEPVAPPPPTPAPTPAPEKTAPAPVVGPARIGGKGHRAPPPPAPPRPPREKPGANPPRLATGARPNPFDDARAVTPQQTMAVVRNPANQAALKSCYERALKMDNHITSGRIDVTVSISASGSVQRVVINAPASFILVEPCIKNAVKRWTFPSNVEDYGMSFPLIMQGGM